MIHFAIGFYHVERDTAESDLGYECARLMVKSARKCMPDVPIVMFTDETSPGVKGVTEIRRKPAEPMALLRMRHHAGAQGQWLFVDTDVIFQQSVRQVFKLTWDIGVTTRGWDHVKEAPGFTARMPYNMGVVFSRNHRFWAECYTRLRDEDAELQEWMGDQQVFCDVLASGRYEVKRLPGATYNFPPLVPGISTAEESQQRAVILHYKGPKRKDLLLKDWGKRACA